MIVPGAAPTGRRPALGQRLGASTPFVSEGRAAFERRTDRMEPQAGVSGISQSGSYCGRSASGGLGPGYHNDPRRQASKGDIPPLKPIAAAGNVHFELADSSADEYSEPESECASQPPMRPQTPAPPHMRASSRPPPTQFMSAALRHPPDGQPLHDARPKNVELLRLRRLHHPHHQGATHR